tara:strand:- start:633 stop:902 length:270 start_codon:yes stop_codon:yes gene_type:complete
MTKKINAKNISKFIDITGEICPMTFVKTKLAIENAKIGDIIQIRIKGREPLENVPRSIVEHGHKILSNHPENPKSTRSGIRLLLVQKQI